MVSPFLLTLTIQAGFMALLVLDARRKRAPAPIPARIAETRSA
jgi:hypothetical protein